jgi:hypothetical protein
MAGQDCAASAEKIAMKSNEPTETVAAWANFKKA